MRNNGPCFPRFPLRGMNPPAMTAVMLAGCDGRNLSDFGIRCSRAALVWEKDTPREGKRERNRERETDLSEFDVRGHGVK